MARGRHIPERSCVACGQKLPKENLVRIVRTPQGIVTVDPTGKMAGRGAYLCWSTACWQRGVSKGGLERTLKLALTPKDRDTLLAFHLEAVSGSSPKE